MMGAVLLVVMFGLPDARADTVWIGDLEPLFVERGDRTDLQVEVMAVIEGARLVPPAVGADVVLRLLESPTTRDVALRLEALELAETLTAAVAEPVRRTLIVGGDLETRSGSRHLGMLMGLDRVSLSLRIVQVLLPLDRVLARERFRGIDLAFEPIPCTSSLVPDVSDFYRLLQTVFDRGFDIAERANGDDVAFLAPFLRLSSATQLKPAADLLAALSIPDPQWELLLLGFGQDLQGLTVDDRSFSNNTIADVSAVVNLARAVEARGVSGGELVVALRSYLVRHARSIRCRDSLERPTALSPGTLASVNALLNSINSTGQIEPITRRQVEYAELSGGLQDTGYWRSRPAKQLHVAASELRFPNSREITNRQSGPWRRGLYDFLTALRAWAGPEEASAEDYRNQKASLFESLLALTLRDEDRSAVLQEWCVFMKDWYANVTAVDEWLYRSRQLLESTSHASIGETAGLCAASTTSALSLYRRVHQLTGR